MGDQSEDVKFKTARQSVVGSGGGGVKLRIYDRCLTFRGEAEEEVGANCDSTQFREKKEKEESEGKRQFESGKSKGKLVPLSAAFLSESVRSCIQIPPQNWKTPLPIKSLFRDQFDPLLLLETELHSFLSLTWESTKPDTAGQFLFLLFSTFFPGNGRS